MDEKKFLEWLHAYALGCLDVDETIEIVQYLKTNPPNYNWQELGDLQNLTSLLPSILTYEAPAPQLKDRVARKLYRLKEAKRPFRTTQLGTFQPPAINTNKSFINKVVIEETPAEETPPPPKFEIDNNNLLNNNIPETISSAEDTFNAEEEVFSNEETFENEQFPSVNEQKLDLPIDPSEYEFPPQQPAVKENPIFEEPKKEEFTEDEIHSKTSEDSSIKMPQSFERLTGRTPRSFERSRPRQETQIRERQHVPEQFRDDAIPPSPSKDEFIINQTDVEKVIKEDKEKEELKTNKDDGFKVETYHFEEDENPLENKITSEQLFGKEPIKEVEEKKEEHVYNYSQQDDFLSVNDIKTTHIELPVEKVETLEEDEEEIPSTVFERKEEEPKPELHDETPVKETVIVKESSGFSFKSILISFILNLILIAGLFYLIDTKLNTYDTKISSLSFEIAKLTTEVREPKALATFMLSKDARTAGLSGEEGFGKLVWDFEKKTGYLQFENVPNPAEGKAYQLWAKVGNDVNSLGQIVVADIKEFTTQFDFPKNAAVQIIMTEEPVQPSRRITGREILSGYLVY